MASPVNIKDGKWFHVPPNVKVAWVLAISCLLGIISMAVYFSVDAEAVYKNDTSELSRLYLVSERRTLWFGNNGFIMVVILAILVGVLSTSLFLLQRAVDRSTLIVVRVLGKIATKLYTIV
jgi:small-conductance mechanosensitive channel